MVVDEFVTEDSFTLMSPEGDCEQVLLHSIQFSASQNSFLLDLEESFEDPGQFSHVELVMELGRSWQDSVLDLVPQLGCCVRQDFNNVVELVTIVLSLEVVFDDRGVNAFDTERQDHIEDHEVPLGSIGNVITSSNRMVHGSNELQVLDILQGSSLALVQHVESTCFDQLSYNFQGFLVTPIVHFWHTHVINEYIQQLIVRRGEVFAHFEVTFHFDVGLISGRFGGRRKVDSLEQLVLLGKFLGIHED